MNEWSLSDAYSCLDLPPDAQPRQVEQTFRRKKELYADGGLAAYSLFEPGARQAHLERLEMAYRRILADHRESPPPPADNCRCTGAGEEPDPEISPGRFLQVRREAAGLTLGEIAEKTKIGRMRLAQIEEEQYDALPAEVYLRGFVITIARTLGIGDAESIARHYLKRYREKTFE